MSDIRNQLIKDSYNYVLQSDLSTGVVYRIGGDIPINPIFQSGLTINDRFIYSNGTEGIGYTLLTDGTGYAYWGPVSAATPSSGVTSVTAGSGLSGNVTTGAVILVNTSPDKTVTITGGTNIQITGTYPDFGVNYTGTTIIQGITGITGTSGVSASTTDYGTTIINTSPDQIVSISGGTGITTGGTYPNFTILNSAPDRTVTITGGTNIQITGTYPDFGINFTGTTGSNFTGGTVSGSTNFTGGLTSNTISATTYENLPVSGITGSTYITATPSNGNYTISLNGPLLAYYVSGSTPSGTQVSGDRWLNTNTGDELVWVDDGDSQQWVQISSIVGGNAGSATLIASSSCLVLSDGNYYIGHNKGGGWSYFDWNLPFSSFGYEYTNCSIPIPQDIPEGNTISVFFVAYSPNIGEKVFVSIYKLSCNDLSVITLLSEDNNTVDSNGNLCFQLNYTLGIGENFSLGSDYIVLGFAGGGSGENIRISYTIKTT